MEMHRNDPRSRFRVARRREPDTEEGYESFEAASLYCPRCKTAMPVRKKLLLILPRSTLYNLVCAQCGDSLGKKEE